MKFALVDSQTGRQPVHGIAERLGSAEAALRWKNGPQKHNRSIPQADHDMALETIIDELRASGQLDEGLAAVGHRVVHGGEAFTRSSRIDDEVIAAIDRCSRLAPLHNPANLLGIRVSRRLFPDVPQVAVFDTAFHQTLPRHAYLYAVPYELYEESGVRRYGFHGTSHRFVTRRAAELLNRPYESLHLISAHLGNGCSATAVAGGRSVDTTLGLTPLEGLVMGTRSGDVDPSLHQFLHEERGWSLAEITSMLNKKSGLLGLSGLSNDMRSLQEAAENGHERAQLAIDIFCYRLAKAIAALVVPLGRLDALIFTGGIGEHASAVRSAVLEQLPFLGFKLDPDRNDAHGRDSQGRITADHSPAALVVPTDEERMIAQDCLDLLNDA